MGKGGSETETNVEVETMVQLQLIANIINCLLHVWFGDNHVGGGQGCQQATVASVLVLAKCTQ